MLYLLFYRLANTYTHTHLHKHQKILQLTNTTACLALTVISRENSLHTREPHIYVMKSFCCHIPQCKICACVRACVWAWVCVCVRGHVRMHTRWTNIVLFMNLYILHKKNKNKNKINNIQTEKLFIFDVVVVKYSIWNIMS